MILVSACLLGIHARYDDGDNTVPVLVKLCQSGKIIPVCPEQLGGLATPRPPCEITGGTGREVISGQARVINKDQVDQTAEFLKGAQETLRIARLFNTTVAILKERSPSCGSNQIYDGNLNGCKISGAGVTAALLKQNNITVFSEVDVIEKPELLSNI